MSQRHVTQEYPMICLAENAGPRASLLTFAHLAQCSLWCVINNQVWYNIYHIWLHDIIYNILYIIIYSILYIISCNQIWYILYHTWLFITHQRLHCARCAKVSSEALGPAFSAKHIMGYSWVTCLWDMRQEEELNSQGGARIMMVPSFREHWDERPLQ